MDEKRLARSGHKHDGTPAPIEHGDWPTRWREVAEAVAAKEVREVRALVVTARTREVVVEQHPARAAEGSVVRRRRCHHPHN